jgi:prepilin-type N-terminal cleavage/methylation domain-containing protein
MRNDSCSAIFFGKKKCAGFTLIEIMLGLALIGIVAGVTIPVYQSFQVRNDLDVASGTIAQTMRRASALSRASSGDLSWGILATTTSITLFQGASYSARNTYLDEVFDLPSAITPTDHIEIIFNKLTGDPTTTGTTTLTSSINETRNININSKGKIEY